MQKMSSKQIQQREEEYPDDIDKVPVKTRHLDRRVVVGVECALPRLYKQPCHQDQSDDHVQGVQTGHRKIDPEKAANMLLEFFGINNAVREVADTLVSGQEPTVRILFLLS